MITIRRNPNPKTEQCFFCGEAAVLEVEHAEGVMDPGVTDVCLDCARALGHASLGNRTWQPKK